MSHNFHQKLLRWKRPHTSKLIIYTCKATNWAAPERSEGWGYCLCRKCRILISWQLKTRAQGGCCWKCLKIKSMPAVTDFSIALAHFLKQCWHSQSSMCIYQNRLYGAAQHHSKRLRSPDMRKVRTHPKHLIHVKIRLLSHIKSLCPQNERFLWHCVNNSGQSV